MGEKDSILVESEYRGRRPISLFLVVGFSPQGILGLGRSGGLFLFLALVTLACTGPSFIDKECIKGRLSAEQAEEINKGPWGHLPTYNRDEEDHCKDCAAAEDRVLAAKCSEFLKKITLHE